MDTRIFSRLDIICLWICTLISGLPASFSQSLNETKSIELILSNHVAPLKVQTQANFNGVNVTSESALKTQKELQGDNFNKSHLNLMELTERNNLGIAEMQSPGIVTKQLNTIPQYCKTSICLPLCCPQNMRLTRRNCTHMDEIFNFPPIYHSSNLTLIDKAFEEHNFRFFVWDPCMGGNKYLLDPEDDPRDEYIILNNGSIYFPKLQQIVHNGKYCLAAAKSEMYDVMICFEDPDVNTTLDDSDADDEEIPIAYPVVMIISIPFLLITFFVYTAIPELKNMHGSTLRCHVGVLITSYVALVIVQIAPQEMVPKGFCVTLAFIIHFSFLASFFWLNVMCFDIWWTFGGFRSLQGSAKQRDRKKFIIYSIYAWGCASLITGICIIMDYVSEIPESFIKPEMGTESCWLNNDAAKALYFYGPMGVTVFCNICLFISTALKISRHKRDTAHHLKGSESRRHDDNKQWFNLYLKLFIVMGINWSMEIISWLFKGPQYLWYITDLTNSLQGLIIFIIFVWKDKIKRLLLKRLGCYNRNYSRNSTRSMCHSSGFRTCTTSAPLQDKTTPFVTANSRNKIATEESSCV